MDEPKPKFLEWLSTAALVLWLLAALPLCIIAVCQMNWWSTDIEAAERAEMLISTSFKFEDEADSQDAVSKAQMEAIGLLLALGYEERAYALKDVIEAGNAFDRHLTYTKLTSLSKADKVVQNRRDVLTAIYVTMPMTALCFFGLGCLVQHGYAEWRESNRRRRLR